MRFKRGLLCMTTVAGLLSMLVAPGFAEVETQKGIELHGFVQMQAGQFVKYKYRSTNFDHKWFQQNLLGFSLNSKVNSRLDVNVTAGGVLTFNTQDIKQIMAPDDFANYRITEFFLDRAEMVLHCDPDPAGKLLDIGIGLWNQKYNREARDLGEYLFRSGAYPGYIYQSGFDACFMQVAGIRLTNSLFDMVHNELLLTSEIEMAPYKDFSLSLLSDISVLNKAVTVGGGVQLHRIFSVDESQTTPKAIYRNGVQMGIAPNYYLDSIGEDAFGQPVYDTLWYTFAGTKLMARFTFDPKPFLGLDMFGEEDLKLYGEVAILGLKSYPNNPQPDANSYTSGRPISQFGYDTLMQKMPMMLGFNVPTFKVLDLLSIECEYYGKKYVNKVPFPWGYGSWSYNPSTCLPTISPASTYGEYDSTATGGKTLYEKGGAVNWKWSVYAKKTLFGNFSITAQAARDHILNTIKGMSLKEFDAEEALVKKDQWYWMLKFNANF